jgi:DNA-directed RNA polymerase specialized sigma24 family protein
LYGIAANELSHFFRPREVKLRAARRLGLERPALDQESEARITALLERDEYRTRLKEALGRLPEGVRQAVELRVVGERGYEAIAARLECTPEAARHALHRSARFQQQLG